MRLPFVNRTAELQRIQRALSGRSDAFVCIYGRRRLGKSRVILESIAKRSAVYYVGDDRDAAVQVIANTRVGELSLLKEISTCRGLGREDVPTANKVIEERRGLLQ